MDALNEPYEDAISSHISRPVFRITRPSDRSDGLPTDDGFADPFGPYVPDLSLAGDRPCPPRDG